MSAAVYPPHVDGLCDEAKQLGQLLQPQMQRLFALHTPAAGVLAAHGILIWALERLEPELADSTCRAIAESLPEELTAYREHYDR